MKDQLFEDKASGARTFQFDEKVASAFDDMLQRSVPFYTQQQEMIMALGKQFYQPGTAIYDLGCSLGTTLINFGQDLNRQDAQLIGYDSSVPMIEKARKAIKARQLDRLIELRYGDLNKGVVIENASVVTMLWTLQFVRPLSRDRLIQTIYRGLVEGGALMLAEKVLTNNSHVNRLFIELYYDYKRRQGYSDEEIIRKREALENVLVPYRIEENMELFRRNGFELCETFFQYYNFVGFLCVKSPLAMGLGSEVAGDDRRPRQPKRAPRRRSLQDDGVRRHG